MSQKWWMGLDKSDEDSLIRKETIESHSSNESFQNSVDLTKTTEQIEPKEIEAYIDSYSLKSESKPNEGAFIKLDRKPDIVSIPIVTTIYINKEHSQSSVFTKSIEQLDAQKSLSCQKERKNFSPIRKIYSMLFSSKNVSKKLT